MENEMTLFKKDLYAGMKLTALENNCLVQGSTYQVMQDEGKEFFVLCDFGRHYLSDYTEEDDDVNEGIVDFAAVF